MVKEFSAYNIVLCKEPHKNKSLLFDNLPRFLNGKKVSAFAVRLCSELHV